eukprot:TRINITY_DN4870_c0_g2_i4.p1 TRINITY_DN4870_c0_g2~~TRINITY_DN4870_c0_g2_i4.p1  ORF type:complete len:226 (-),score=22.41 TRINITY_DN4870_c0_g2_i4:68-745(-)
MNYNPSFPASSITDNVSSFYPTYQEIPLQQVPYPQTVPFQMGPVQSPYVYTYNPIPNQQPIYTPTTTTNTMDPAHTHQTTPEEVDKVTLAALALYAIASFISLIFALIGFSSGYYVVLHAIIASICAKSCGLLPVMGFWYKKQVQGSPPKSFWIMLCVLVFESVLLFILFLVLLFLDGGSIYHGGWILSLLQCLFVGGIFWRHQKVVRDIYHEAFSPSKVFEVTL